MGRFWCCESDDNQNEDANTLKHSIYTLYCYCNLSQLQRAKIIFIIMFSIVYDHLKLTSVSSSPQNEPLMSTESKKMF